MDNQKKKNEMGDILPSDENKKEVILNYKLKVKGDEIKPVIQLTDIAVKKEEPFVGRQAERAEILDKFSVFGKNQEDIISIAEEKNKIVEIDKKNKMIDFIGKIFKKSQKEEQLLLQEKKNSNFKKYIIYFLIIAMTASALYAAIYILPKAEISIVTKKSAWNFNGIVSASKDAGSINLADKQIPAEVFKDFKILALSFPAHGKKYVERKATGEIMIYNSYSSQPQVLIAGTRIESPDGKIFRLDKKITVPGAKIEEGKIVASAIKTAVTAEKAGEEYNIAPVNKFTIPGLKGTAKYDGFYAVSSEAMKGGIVGDVFFPNEEDILLAKEKTSARLLEDMNSFLLSQFNNNDFKVLEWNKIFKITKENIDKEADKDGNFLVSIEGELKIIVFRESDLLKLMSETAKQILGQSFEIKNFELKYESGQYNADGGKMTLNLEFNGEFWQPINIENFKNSIINKKENELKVFVFSIPGVEKATFSLWPKWVRKVPDLMDKINVKIN